ncbi:pyridoxamine 5'-phosphate oxidase family protein [Actinomadura sp. SCN-SB]|uniref:pyridoxamine 5'-phosphate oxidase family protein n=1 Tax=Actinomadura sp. SCN-SB TaxID=3373092 RepID=UPI00375181EF
MKEPVARFDHRFSDPGAQETPWPVTRETLESAQLFWITTVRADGRPHVTPLVAVWLDDALHFCTGPEEQKALNLAANPNVVLTTGCNEWKQGLDVMVEGEAQRVTDRPALERLAAAWAAKWEGQWRFRPNGAGFSHDTGGAPDEGESVAHVFAVKPSKILAFGKGGFSQTTYLPAS